MPCSSIVSAHAAASLERRHTGAMLLYLDLDNFKAINDRFGHAAGDCLLVAVATRLQELVRASDTVARLGGDEFVVLAEGLDDAPAAARTLAERIHVAMRAPVAMGDRQLYTSVSIGIAEVVPDANPEVSLAQADAAMYQAKRSGPARYEVYDAVIGADSRARASWPTNCGWPTRAGSSRSTTSRCSGWAATWSGWRHCSGGTIPNSAPSLRSSSSRCSSGAGRSSRRPLGARRGRRPVPPVAGAGPPRADHVGQRLGPPTAGPRLLRRRGGRAVAVGPGSRIAGPRGDRVGAGRGHRSGRHHHAGRIRELGVHLALDDFGTGYSSLLYLQGLPIDRLKVDRSFVAGLGSPEQDPTIVAAVVDLAHKLGIRVVAEGVETEAELARHRGHGVRRGPGLPAWPGPDRPIPLSVGQPALNGTGTPPTLTACRLRRLNIPFWARVERRELGEQPVVAVTTSGSGWWMAATGTSERSSSGVDCAQGQAGQQGAAPEVGVHRVGDLLDGPVEDVGEDGAPERRGRPAPDGPDRAEPADR